jgi:hypothetical protein
MFRHLGYYVTESSGHNSEYNAWFRKRPDLIEKYCTHGTGYNPGVYGYNITEYLKQEQNWKANIEQWLTDPKPLDLARGNEYAASIINAWAGGDPFKFNGNVANEGLIDNLPRGACVEVPVYADRQGFNPIHVGSLPPQCAALNNISVAVEEMAVEGCLVGDPTMVFHAICYDPLTSAVLSLAEIRQMVDMFEKDRSTCPPSEIHVAPPGRSPAIRPAGKCSEPTFDVGQVEMLGTPQGDAHDVAVSVAACADPPGPASHAALHPDLPDPLVDEGCKLRVQTMSPSSVQPYILRRDSRPPLESVQRPDDVVDAQCHQRIAKAEQRVCEPVDDPVVPERIATGMIGRLERT